MSNTYKIERARKLNGYDKSSKAIKLIPTGNPQGLRNTATDELHEYHVDNGGDRYGNQRKMRAKMKVDSRKSERMKRKQKLFEDGE